MAREDVTLSGSQYQLMQVLWELGEATAAEIRDAWPGSKTPAHTTVGTVLTRLEKRDLLTSERRGRERVFRPLINESDVRRSMVSQMVGTLFAGDPYALLTHLIKETDVTPKDLEAAQRLLDEGSKK